MPFLEGIRSVLEFLSHWVLPFGFLFIVVSFFYSIFVLGRKGMSTMWERTPRRRRG